MKEMTIAAAGVVLAMLGTGICLAADWPQWRGPHRDGTSAEAGLLQTWPEPGPRLAWAATGLGDGFSSIAIADGQVYTTGMIDGRGYVHCLDHKGERRWRTPYDEFKYARSTPTVDGDRLYVMSANGTVLCLDARTGEGSWTLDTVATFGAVQPSGGHGISESVLVVGDLVICTPGGAEAAVVGIDKLTGKAVWSTDSVTEVSGFNQPIAIARAGRQLAVVMTALSMLGIDAVSGEVLWRHAYSKLEGQCLTPIWHREVLYAPTGENGLAEAFRLSADGAELTPLWTQKRMTPHHGGVVPVGGYLYGTHGHWRLACLDIRNGNMMFESVRKTGSGAIIAADGMLYLLLQDGVMNLVRATPKLYEPVSTFKIELGSGKFWAHPAIADGFLYVRHGDALAAYDIRAR